MKVNVSFDDKLMEEIDRKADELYMTRSGFIALACVEKLQQMKAVELLDQMTAAYKAIAIKGEVDQQLLTELDLLQKYFNAIYGR